LAASACWRYGVRNITDRPKILATSAAAQPDGVLVSGKNTSTRFDPVAAAGRLVVPFSTTKSNGIGRGAI
jgi:hypothetical protein